jgi:integrase
MAYEVRKQPYGRGWKILYTKQVGGKRFSKAVSWLDLGFRADMTLEEAQEWKDKLNAEEHRKHWQERRMAVQRRVDGEQEVESVFLPKLLRAEFEQAKLYGDSVPERPEKTLSSWRAACKAIAVVEKEPEQWVDHKEAFYRYFQEQQMSYQYVQKLVLLLNRWGRFYCRRRKVFFEELPLPGRATRLRIMEANRRKKVKRGNRVSAPLSFDMLESKRSQLTVGQANWLFLSIAFGLRPEEIDERNGVEPIRIVHEGDTPVLEVYQSKLKSTVTYEECWKYIPAILPEQKKAVELLEAEAPIVRPSTKTLKKVFGPAFTHYCGRNNFTPMMLALGKGESTVASWMGHKDIETTHRYAQKLRKRADVLKGT